MKCAILIGREKICCALIGQSLKGPLSLLKPCRVVQCSFLFICSNFFFFVIKVVVVNFVMFVCFDLYVVCTIPVKRK